MVGLDQPLRVRHACFGGEVEAVDGVAAVRREGHALAGLEVGGARLGVLAGEPAELHHRHGGGVRQDDRHLQEHPELVADVVGRGARERLGAVAALEEERLALRDLAELDLEVVALTGEDQRRQRAQARDGGVDRDGVRVGRLLRRARARAATPGRGWSRDPGYGARPGARPSPTSSGRRGEARGRVARMSAIETCRRRRLRRTGEPARRGGRRSARPGTRSRSASSVRAAGVNAYDAKVYASPGDPAKLPMRARVRGRRRGQRPSGSDVSGWSEGDEVIAFRASGAYASDLVVDAHALTAKPHSSGLGRGGRDDADRRGRAGTRWWRRGSRDGDTVLVHGATGGVGLPAVQLARLRGARVIGTTNPRNDDLLRELGVEPVAYGDGLLDRVRSLAPDGVDVALDLVGHRRGDGRLAGAGRGPGPDRDDRELRARSARGRPAARQRPGCRPRHRDPRRWPGPSWPGSPAAERSGCSWGRRTPWTTPPTPTARSSPATPPASWCCSPSRVRHPGSP